MESLFKKLLVLRMPKIGPVKYKSLLAQYKSLDAVIDFLHPDDDFKDSVKREMDKAFDLGIEYIADDDSRYPKNLLNVPNHPIVITVRGNIDTLNKKMVAMVGTRHSSATGMEFMAQLARGFAEHNFSVVSGMAMGIDTSAHMGALSVAGNAQTIAVLAGGVDYIWPLENESLYYEILERGLIISEMPIGIIPQAGHFIQRNQWIAALSDLFIVGEADSKSGSMSTARFAINYGKQIFAVPGHPSDPRSVGPNSLIKENKATLCMSVNDFFDDVKTIKNKQNVSSQNDILDKLGMIPVPESVLANLVKKNVAEIKTDLVMLEMQGLIRKENGGYVLN